MTSNEMLSLESHDKIKFVGNPSDYTPPPHKQLIRGKIYTVSSIYPGKNHTALMLWHGTIDVPKGKEVDWVLEEKRHAQVESNRLSKLGVHFSRSTLIRFRNEVNVIIKSYQDRFNGYLNNIRIAEKMLLLAKLEPLEKSTAEFLFEHKDIETLLETWQKGRENPDEERKEQ